MGSLQLYPLLALTLSFAFATRSFTYAHVDVDHAHDCAMEHPPESELQHSVANEVASFGKPVGEMSRREVSFLFNDLAGRDPDVDLYNRRLQEGAVPTYKLRNIPIAYHILQNQDNGAIGVPRATTRQLEYMTKTTNDLFDIYDRGSRQSVQFASFVMSDTIVHEDEFDFDCNDLVRDQLRPLITRVEEWEFKMHVVICESSVWSGVASLPWSFEDTDPLHNMLRIDYRAIACYDGLRRFLCERTDSVPESHTRWWRTESKVLAHELGHMFGLFHTFSRSTCNLVNDMVSDTPAEISSNTNTCQGLLPYDRTRDLFDTTRNADVNLGNPFSCGGAEKVCGSTCAACCTDCEFYDAWALESFSEEDYDAPFCCEPEPPEDSCPELPGLDPKNNVMSYVPDWCVHEFTPGQMIRMMAETRADKRYIYCNYGDVLDPELCDAIPCGRLATSPNCNVEQCRLFGRCELSLCSPRECFHGFCVGLDECMDSTCIEPPCLSCDSCDNKQDDCGETPGCTFEGDSVQMTCSDFGTRRSCIAVPGCIWDGLLFFFGTCGGTRSITFGQCSGSAAYTCE